MEVGVGNRAAAQQPPLHALARRQVCKRHPHLRAKTADLPNIEAAARDNVAAAGLADRVEVGGRADRGALLVWAWGACYSLLCGASTSGLGSS